MRKLALKCLVKFSLDDIEQNTFGSIVRSFVLFPTIQNVLRANKTSQKFEEILKNEIVIEKNGNVIE
jgi:hypothetical protein